ncbi:MAG: aminoacyl-histidine dipeptidase [Bacteroidetes bacterium]|nr:aminoacyl-histidine dipeptidase [Bacteroidota bacterium]
MSDAIKGLQPQAVWEYFEELSQIPRESGNEKEFRKYLINFAKQKNFSWAEDSIGNVVIRKPASSGNEKILPTVLQSHMDMVCVKTSESEHDFTSDPIKLVRKGEWMRADNTTLGADNGIAIAMTLALFADSNAVHGPLEALFTISEETGLDGALNLDISLLDSRRLINIDSEEEGEFIIGCAGGSEIVGTLKADYNDVPKNSESWKVSLSGFLGGHSGSEIHTGRGTAIKYGVRFLRGLITVPGISLMISEISGGTKRNVIPSTFSCTFTTKSGNSAVIKTAVEKLENALTAELAKRDPGAVIELVKTENPQSAVSIEQSASVINTIYITPHGPESWSVDIDGLVETSNNFAVISLTDGQFFFDTSQRSSIMSARDEIAERTWAALETCGAKVEKINTYPSWTPDTSSPFAEVCANSYQELTGARPLVTAIHAGLECGVINSKAAGMDSISFGPDIRGAHSVEERLDIGSTERIYTFLKKLVADLCR